MKIHFCLPRILSISSHFLISLTYFRWNVLTVGLSCKQGQADMFMHFGNQHFLTFIQFAGYFIVPVKINSAFQQLTPVTERY